MRSKHTTKTSKPHKGHPKKHAYSKELPQGYSLDSMVEQIMPVPMDGVYNITTMLLAKKHRDEHHRGKHEHSEKHHGEHHQDSHHYDDSHKGRDHHHHGYDKKRDYGSCGGC